MRRRSGLNWWLVCVKISSHEQKRKWFKAYNSQKSNKQEKKTDNSYKDHKMILAWFFFPSPKNKIQTPTKTLTTMTMTMTVVLENATEFEMQPEKKREWLKSYRKAILSKSFLTKYTTE